MPVQGWATPALSGYWKGINWPKTPTATRPVPTSATPTTTPPVSGDSNINVGVIAGGTFGGVLAFAGIAALVFLCLRRRRAKPPHGHAETTPEKQVDPHDRGMTQNHTTYDGISQANTGSPCASCSPACSPQASPSPQGWCVKSCFRQTPQSLHPSGEWPAGPYQQTYYSTPSQSPMHLRLQEISIELPDANSPANAELSDVRSPVSGELPDKQLPKPVHGP
jgi:hypothetical protein